MVTTTPKIPERAVTRVVLKGGPVGKELFPPGIGVAKAVVNEPFKSAVPVDVVTDRWLSPDVMGGDAEVDDAEVHDANSVDDADLEVNDTKLDDTDSEVDNTESVSYTHGTDLEVDGTDFIRKKSNYCSA